MSAPALSENLPAHRRVYINDGETAGGLLENGPVTSCRNLARLLVACRRNRKRHRRNEDRRRNWNRRRGERPIVATDGTLILRSAIRAACIPSLLAILFDCETLETLDPGMSAITLRRGGAD